MPFLILLLTSFVFLLEPELGKLVESELGVSGGNVAEDFLVLSQSCLLGSARNSFLLAAWTWYVAVEYAYAGYW
jgi:hypothetical protein